jgi:hypothetical protein
MPRAATNVLTAGTGAFLGHELTDGKMSANHALVDHHIIHVPTRAGDVVSIGEEGELDEDPLTLSGGGDDGA